MSPADYTGQGSRGGSCFSYSVSLLFPTDTSPSIDKSIHLEMGVPAPGLSLHAHTPCAILQYNFTYKLLLLLRLNYSVNLAFNNIFLFRYSLHMCGTAPKRANEDGPAEAIKKPRIEVRTMRLLCYIVLILFSFRVC